MTNFTFWHKIYKRTLNSLVLNTRGIEYKYEAGMKKKEKKKNSLVIQQCFQEWHRDPWLRKIPELLNSYNVISEQQ